MSARLAALLGMLAEEPPHPSPSDRAGPFLPRVVPAVRGAVDAIERLRPFAAVPGSAGAAKFPGNVGVLLDPEGVAIASDGWRAVIVPVQGVKRRRIVDLDTGAVLERPFCDPREKIKASEGELPRPVFTRTLRLIAEIAQAASSVRTWNPSALVRVAPDAAVRIDSPGTTCALHATALAAESEGVYFEASPRVLINDYAANYKLPASYYHPRHLIDALKGAPPIVGLRMLKEPAAELVVLRADGEQHVIGSLKPVIVTVKEHSPA